MKKLLTILLSILLLVLGFFAGMSWFDYQAENDSDSLQPAHKINAKPVKNVDEKADTTLAGPTYLNPQERATIKLFEKATSSVAFITTTSLRMDFYTRNVLEIPRGSGSGFVWDKKGHVVTNYHVIRNSDRAQVTLADRSTYNAKVIGVAPDKDLAILKIDASSSELHPVELGESSELQVGQNVYAIGNPFGLDQTLTTGIISALGREIKSVSGIPIRDVIQTDAAINPGNSGGPLLDSSGKLIGVNTAIYSPSGAYAGIGFSIPVNAVKWVVPDLIKYGKLQRPVLGVELANTQINKRLGLEGVLIINVLPGTGAEKAGLRSTTRDARGNIQYGDIIVSINDEKITSYSDLLLTLEQYEAGQDVLLTILRNDKKMEVVVQLDEPK